MNFEGIELKTMGEIFDKALETAKTKDQKRCESFLLCYADWIKEENPEMVIEDCLKRAKSNLGYFAGYYSTETAKLIENSYRAIHPIFGSAYDRDKYSAEDFFRMGQEHAQRHSESKFYD